MAAVEPERIFQGGPVSNAIRGLIGTS